MKGFHMLEHINIQTVLDAHSALLCYCIVYVFIDWKTKCS